MNEVGHIELSLDGLDFGSWQGELKSGAVGLRLHDYLVVLED